MSPRSSQPCSKGACRLMATHRTRHCTISKQCACKRAAVWYSLGGSRGLQLVVAVEACGMTACSWSCHLRDSSRACWRYSLLHWFCLWSGWCVRCKFALHLKLHATTASLSLLTILLFIAVQPLTAAVAGMVGFSRRRVCVGYAAIGWVQSLCRRLWLPMTACPGWQSSLLYYMSVYLLVQSRACSAAAGHQSAEFRQAIVCAV
jgi:hypothetical protein